MIRIIQTDVMTGLAAIKINPSYVNIMRNVLRLNEQLFENSSIEIIQNTYQM